MKKTDKDILTELYSKQILNEVAPAIGAGGIALWAAVAGASTVLLWASTQPEVIRRATEATIEKLFPDDYAAFQSRAQTRPPDPRTMPGFDPTTGANKA